MIFKYKNVWKYTLKEEHKYSFSKKYAKMVLRELKLIDKKGFHCATIYPSNKYEGAHIIMQAGYSWDGCSFKVQVSKWIIGTPDSKKTWEASLIHDFMCQFKYEIPFNIDQIDAIFYVILKKHKFWASWLYYNAVRAYRLF